MKSANGIMVAYFVPIEMTRVRFPVSALLHSNVERMHETSDLTPCLNFEGFIRSAIGLVVEYIVAIDVTRVRFPDRAPF